MKMNYVNIVVWIITFFLLFLIIFNIAKSVFNMNNMEYFTIGSSMSLTNDELVSSNANTMDDFLNNYINRQIFQNSGIIDSSSLYFFVYDNNINLENQTIQQMNANKTISFGTMYSIYDNIQNMAKNLYFPKGEIIILTPKDIQNIFANSSNENGGNYNVNTSIYSQQSNAFVKTNNYISIDAKIIQNASNMNNEIYPLFAAVHDANGNPTNKFALINSNIVRKAITGNTTTPSANIPDVPISNL